MVGGEAGRGWRIRMTDKQLKLIAMYCTSCGEVSVVRTKPDPHGTVVCSCGGWVGGNSDGAWNYAELPGKSVTLELLDQVRQEISEELGGVEELLADVHMDAGEHTKKVGLAQSIVDARLELQEWDRDVPVSDDDADENAGWHNTNVRVDVLEGRIEELEARPNVIDNMASELSSAIVQLADQEVRIKELEGIQPQRVVHRDPDLQRQFNELSARMGRLETSTRQDWIDWVTDRIKALDKWSHLVEGKFERADLFDDELNKFQKELRTLREELRNGHPSLSFFSEQAKLKEKIKSLECFDVKVYEEVTKSNKQLDALQRAFNVIANRSDTHADEHDKIKARLDKVEALAKRVDEEMLAQGVAEGVSHQLAELDAKVGRHQERIDGIDEYLGKKLGAVSERTEKALEEVFRDVAHNRDVVMSRLDTHKEMVDRFAEQARGLEEKVNMLRDLVGKHAEEHCALDGRDGKAITELQKRLFGSGGLTPTHAERLEQLENGQLRIGGISQELGGLSEQFDAVKRQVSMLAKEMGVEGISQPSPKEALKRYEALEEKIEELEDMVRCSVPTSWAERVNDLGKRLTKVEDKYTEMEAQGRGEHGQEGTADA
jgi:hypothetical protein